MKDFMNLTCDNSSIQQIKYIDLWESMNLQTGRFEKIQDISEVRPGDKFVHITERTKGFAAILHRLEGISHNYYLVSQGRDSTGDRLYNWENCYRMIEG